MKLLFFADPLHFNLLVARRFILAGRYLPEEGTLVDYDEVNKVGTKGTAKPAEDVPEPYNHGKNLIRRRQSG
jgi:hypothetical protein